MSGFEELMQAALVAPEDRKAAALRLLRGEASPTPTVVGPEPYLRMKEVASRLGISVCSLWRYGVPGHQLGGRRRFRMGEVVAYLESEEFKTRAEELKEERREGLGKERKKS